MTDFRHYFEFHMNELDRPDKMSYMLTDLDEKIAAQKAKSTRAGYDFEEYHTYEEIKDFSKSLTGEDVEYKVYGQSEEGRELFAVEIGSGDSVRYWVFVSSVIGDSRLLQSIVEYMPVSGFPRPIASGS